MQIMTDLSAFHLEINRQKSIPSAAGLIKQLGLAAEQADWSQRMLKIEKWANRFCIAIVALSVLYFTPIVISILLR